MNTVYPKKYAHGFCFAVLCCGYTLTDFPISIRLTSLALWQSNDCPSASKATLMNMDKYFIWIHYERLHNQNKAKHNKKPCAYFLGYTVYEQLLLNSGDALYIFFRYVSLTLGNPMIWLSSPLLYPCFLLMWKCREFGITMYVLPGEWNRYWEACHIMTLSNGIIFRVTGPLDGEIHRSPVNSPHKGQWCFDVFFDPRLSKRLSNQSGRQWSETSSRSSWRHCNENIFFFGMAWLPNVNEGTLINIMK